MNGGSAPKGASKTAGRRSTSSVQFVAQNVSGCVRVDLTRPANRERFAEGEVGKRIYRATAGMPAGCVLQLYVSESTPMHDIRIPSGLRVQVTASDAQTVAKWMSHVSGVIA